MRKFYKIVGTMSLLLFAGCSEFDGAVTSSTSSSASVDDVIESIEDTVSKDATSVDSFFDDVVDVNDSSDAVSVKNKDECYEETWYFCPPLNAIWQFKIVLDICEDPPVVIEIGECIEKFECDPSNNAIEIIECESDDGEKGIQEKWCEKGYYQYNPCAACVDEVCDGLDNDCDEEIDEDIAIQTCENECGLGDLICVAGEEVCFAPDPEEEICDGIDNDCDGETDEGFSEIEEICNSIDDNCNGLIDEDLEDICENECGLGDLLCVAGEEVCLTPDPEEEVCDGEDNDCDGLIDEGFEDIEEICNNIDDNCNGIVDEGNWICESECGLGDLLCVAGVEICTAPTPEEEICDYKDNDCDGEVDENQQNDCGKCGPLPEEICNNIDDDCDGALDENLVETCSSDCGDGLIFCSEGDWTGCTAKQPMMEICNGFDDNCDGQIDEGLSCLCNIQDVGVLFPCIDIPLICGSGYKTCECVDEDCTEMKMTPCYAMCYWQKPLLPSCDILKGTIEDEVCNSHDDNCNQLIDEDLQAECYTGEPETLFVGICLPGGVTCEKGEWGNWYETEAGDETFVPDLCLGETLPENKDTCNGEDDDCDGEVDDGKEMEDTDILFIIDYSGSMNVEIQAVMTAMNMFAGDFSDKEVIKWGLIIGPVIDPNYNLYAFPPIEYLQFVTQPVDFQQFVSSLTGLSPYVDGGAEMLYDAVYLAVHNLGPASGLPWQLDELSWLSNIQNVSSVPQLNQFIVDWRPDAHHIVIVFTDEQGQSFLFKDMNSPGPSYGLLQSDLLQAIQNSLDLNVYTFTPTFLKTIVDWQGTKTGWEPLTQYGGKWYELTSSTAIMYEKLLEILDENACGP